MSEITEIQGEWGRKKSERYMSQKEERLEREDHNKRENVQETWWERLEYINEYRKTEEKKEGEIRKRKWTMTIKKAARKKWQRERQIQNRSKR